jgi:hypothetical protein
MILGVRNAIRKCHKMNEGSVIVILAHHNALILPYEFLVVFSSAICLFSCILTAIQLEIRSPVQSFITFILCFHPRMVYVILQHGMPFKMGHVKRGQSGDYQTLQKIR